MIQSLESVYVGGKIEYQVIESFKVLFLTQMLNCSDLFFIHLKLELVTQFPAPNDEK